MKETAFITGAGGTLGQAVSRRLAETHRHIILHDAELAALEPLYDRIERETRCEPILFPLNFRLAGAGEFMQLEQALAEHGEPVDTLVLNAAALPAFTPLSHFDPTQWYEVLQVNLNAHFHILQAVLPHLGEGAEVLLISDALLNNPQPFGGAYAVAKAGLEQLIRTLQAERDDLNCRIERVGAFQGPWRQRLFPGADNSKLPTAEAVAEQLVSGKDRENTH
ncbi:SDR family NAD(P)-dependent oxidoreductase [Sulfurivirga sp.]|uniref:SDR family NAD(P)-dependent oxidoreductase n=1 Tax=Sulfurivirga sp. TaxID=2614236 RepID=UPI002600E7E4|nr:SDR family NAD(P)-dependent oxidoreductase [Sulfurivirga sp.]